MYALVEDHDAAIASLTQARAHLLHTLGLHEGSDFSEARLSLRSRQQLYDVYNNMGVSQRARGSTADAIASWQQVCTD